MNLCFSENFIGAFSQYRSWLLSNIEETNNTCYKQSKRGTKIFWRILILNWFEFCIWKVKALWNFLNFSQNNFSILLLQHIKWILYAKAQIIHLYTRCSKLHCHIECHINLMDQYTNSGAKQNVAQPYKGPRGLSFRWKVCHFL